MRQLKQSKTKKANLSQLLDINSQQLQCTIPEGNNKTRFKPQPVHVAVFKTVDCSKYTF